MANDAESIYQLKITLDHIKPPIWRRVLAPTTVTLADLHDIIQAVMPWDDSHLHLFQKGSETFSPPDPYGSDIGDADSNEVLLADVLTAPKQKLRYLYDFGDSWDHTIQLEKILPFDPESIYPQCTAGKRACPPEDCGGPPGYATMLEALKDPKHSEHELYLDWLGDEFDPEAFDVEEANELLFMELYLDDTEPPMAPINRHLVVMTPTQAYLDLRDRLQDPNVEAVSQGSSPPLAFLVPITPSLSDLEGELESLTPMFTAIQMLMETFDPEMVAELTDEDLEGLFSFSVIPLVFDLDWQSPLFHLTPDLLDEEFAEE